MTKVVIVGQGLFLEGLTLLLSEEDDVEIIGMAGNCSDALEIAIRERPEVILLDHLQILENQIAFNTLLESVDSLRVISLTLSENKMVVHNRQQFMDVTLPVLRHALHPQSPGIKVEEPC